MNTPIIITRGKVSVTVWNPDTRRMERLSPKATIATALQITIEDLRLAQEAGIEPTDARKVNAGEKRLSDCPSRIPDPAEFDEFYDDRAMLNMLEAMNDSGLQASDPPIRIPVK